MRGETNQRGRVFFIRWFLFMFGIMIMSFGIVLMIRADLGNAPWDVFHIGLYTQFGLTIGTWSIIAGVIIIGIACLLTKKWPQAGAVLNMLLVGVFIDLYMLIPWLTTPDFWLWKLAMLLAGTVIMGYGMGLYIAPKCGAGPRDSLMLAIRDLTGWKVQWVRGGMEVIVLVAGWLLGGPVFVGTIIFCLAIGPLTGYTLPQCEKLVNKIIEKSTGGAIVENIHERPVRVNHHDGVSS